MSTTYQVNLLTERTLHELDAVLDYYVYSESTWIYVQQEAMAGKNIVFTNPATGSQVDQTQIPILAIQ
jgi:hypothetical protein